MKNHLRGLRTMFMAVAPFFGHFGATKDNSPESFMPAVEIEGTGPGKAASRKKNHRPHLRKAGIEADLFFTRERQNAIYATMTKRDRRAKQIVGSMRGTEQLRDDRRRRSAGLPRRDQVPDLSTYLSTA